MHVFSSPSLGMRHCCLWCVVTFIALCFESYGVRTPDYGHSNNQVDTSRQFMMPVSQLALNESESNWGFSNSLFAVEAEDLVASIEPQGVWMAESGKLRSTQKEIAQSSTGRGKYGFYLHTFSEGAACVHLLQEVRRVYPNEPVYVMSDGGANFSGICNEIGNCNFQWRPPANDRWNPLPFFNRFREAARWLGTKFVIMLEPDVELRGRIVKEPSQAAGGLRDSNPAFGKDMISYIETQGKRFSGDPNYKVKWDHFGLAGGSYFSTAAALHAFIPEDMDWHVLRKLDSKRIWSSDVAMALALATHGYTYYPWSELTQKRYGLNDKSAWRHYGRDELKPLYSGQGANSKPPDLSKLVWPATPTPGSVTCQGCVWASDDVCYKQRPIQCPFLAFDHGPPQKGNRRILAHG